MVLLSMTSLSPSIMAMRWPLFEKRGLIMEFWDQLAVKSLVVITLRSVLLCNVSRTPVPPWWYMTAMIREPSGEYSTHAVY